MTDPVSRSGLPPLGGLPAYPDANAAAAQGSAAGSQAPDAATQAAQSAQLAALFGLADAGPGAAPRQPGAGKFAANGATALPPPPAPRTQVTPRTEAAYASLNGELQQALAGVGGGAAGQAARAASAAAGGAAGATISPLTDPAGASAQAATWLQDLISGLNQSQGDALRAFMRLRLEGNSEGMAELERLGDGAGQMQKEMLVAQAEHTKQAQAAADKAAAKAEKLKHLSLGMTIALAIVTAVIAVCTLGTAALLCVAAAAAIGFVAGGLAPSKGKLFDAEKGLAGATQGADIVMMVCMVGAIISAMRQVAAETAAEAAAKAAAKGSAAAGRAAGEAAAGAATQAATRGSSEAATAATEALSKATEQELKALLKDKSFLRRVTDEIMKGADKGVGSTLLQRLGGPAVGGKVLVGGGLALATLQGAASGSKAVIQRDVALDQADANEQQALVKMLGALAERFKRSYADGNDIMQFFTQSRSRAVDVSQSLLKTQQNASQAVIGNMLGR